MGKERKHMKKNQSERVKNLFSGLAQIDDREIREKVVDVWVKAWKASNFKTINSPNQWEPNRDEIRASNLEHTNQVVQCAIAMAKVLEEIQKIKINLDYLIAGALLHDVDKFLIFDSRTAGFSSLGKQFNHTFLSGHLALAAGLPPEVVHIVVAHSPNFSAIEPQSVEALIVRLADHLMGGSWNMKRKIKINYKAGK
jgi:putative nucleotidyltransferase with HDIG domain